MTLSTPDIEKLRELASEMLAALTALYEACERRANEEGGDFGDDIGPAAELADAAIAKAALLDSLPSPVSVPEGDARADWVLVPPTATVEECGGNWCIWLDPALPYVYGFATKDEADRLARTLDRALRRHKPAALLSAESRGERKMRERAALTAVKYDSRAYRAIDSLPLSSPEGGGERYGDGERRDTVSDLICRKTMRVCETPGMCSPWGGCPPVAEWPAPAAVEVEITRLRARITELEGERDILLAENDAFRAGTGNSKEPCIYCGLSAEDQLRCRDGFPGCARADDQMLCRHFAAELEVLDRATAAEAERDTATRALAVLDKIAWLAAEEDSWFGNENDIAVQRAAAERHRAALSKTEGKG